MISQDTPRTSTEECKKRDFVSTFFLTKRQDKNMNAPNKFVPVGGWRKVW